MEEIKKLAASPTKKEALIMLDDLLARRSHSCNLLDEVVKALKTDGNENVIPKLEKLKRDLDGIEHNVAVLREYVDSKANRNSLSKLPDKGALKEQWTLKKQDPGAMIFLDMDSLKSLNDLLSHVGADQLIKETGRIMDEAVKDLVPDFLSESDPSGMRRKDWGNYLFHMSGDEFVINLPWDELARTPSPDISSDEEMGCSSPSASRMSTSSDEQPLNRAKQLATEFARRLLDRIGSDGAQAAFRAAAAPFLDTNSDIPTVSLSAGVSTYRSHEDLKDVSARADEALSRAKTLGAGTVYTEKPKEESEAASKELLRLCKTKGSTIDSIYDCVKKGADLNLKDEKGNTSIMLCIEHGNLRAAEYLCMQNGFNPNITNDKGETPLMMSLKRRLDKVVYLLASKRFNAHLRDAEGTSILRMALAKPYYDVVKVLIQKGAKGPEINRDYWIAAKKAAIRGDVDTLRCLIEKGWHPNAFGKLEDTVLTYAAKAGSLASVKFLVEHGASVNSPDQYGKTPLMFALESTALQKTKIAEYLISNGADLNACTIFGKSVLDFANECCAPTCRKAFPEFSSKNTEIRSKLIRDLSAMAR